MPPKRAAYPAHWGEPPKIQTRDYVPLPGNYGHGSGTLKKWIEKKIAEDAKKQGIPEYPKHWGEPPKVQTRDYVRLPGNYGHGSGTLKKWIEKKMAEDAGKQATSKKKGPYPEHWGEPPKIQSRDYVRLPGKYGHGSSTLKKWIEQKMADDAHHQAAGELPSFKWVGVGKLHINLPPPVSRSETVELKPSDYGKDNYLVPMADGIMLAVTGPRDSNEINITMGGLGSFIWRDRDDIVVRPESPFAKGAFCGTVDPPALSRKRSGSSSPGGLVKKRPSAHGFQQKLDLRAAAAAMESSLAAKMRKNLEEKLASHVDAFTIFHAIVTKKAKEVHHGHDPFNGKEFVVFHVEFKEAYKTNRHSKTAYLSKPFKPDVTVMDCGPRGPWDPAVEEGSSVLLGVWKFNNQSDGCPQTGLAPWMVHVD